MLRSEAMRKFSQTPGGRNARRLTLLLSLCCGYGVALGGCGEDVGSTADGESSSGTGGESGANAGAGESGTTARGGSEASAGRSESSAGSEAEAQAGASGRNAAGTDAGGQGTSAGSGGQSAQAAGSGGAPSEQPSGTRLKQRYVVAPGGAENFVGMFDTETGNLCSYQLTGEDPAQDIYRCVAMVFGAPLFRDAACSEPMVYTIAGQCPFEVGDFVYSLDPTTEDGCTGPVRFFDVDEILEPSTVYRSFVEGECNEEVPNENYGYYAVSEPDFSRFVRGTRRSEPLSDANGLELRYMDGDDGSTAPFGTGLDGGPCTIYETGAAPDDAYCLPPVQPYYGPEAYLSEDCSGQPYVRKNESGCSVTPNPSVWVLREDTTSSCSGIDSVFEVGEKADSNAFYTQSDGECVAGTPSDNVGLYELGDELPLSELPQIVLSEQGQGRIISRNRTTEDGEHALLARGFYDTELEQLCDPRLVSDGSLRCIPETWASSYQYFSDSDCTETLYHLTESACQSPPDRLFSSVFGFLDDACTSGVQAVYDLEPYSGDVYEQQSDFCSAAQVPDGTQIFERGAEVPMSELAELSYEDR